MPPVSIAAVQYASRAFPVLDTVAAMSAPPSDMCERERRVVQALWHLLGNTLPGEAHVELARWYCPNLQSVEARMHDVAARAAASANQKRPES